MNNFKKKFPSLVIKEQTNIDVKDLRYSVWTIEKLLKDIEKYCLDKKLVEKVLDDNIHAMMFKKLAKMKNELGLKE